MLTTSLPSPPCRAPSGGVANPHAWPKHVPEPADGRPRPTPLLLPLEVSAAGHTASVVDAEAAPEEFGYRRWSDRAAPVLGALLAIPAAPVVGVLWVAVRLSSPGGGFYRQVRLGQHNRPFTIVKLRTMRHDAERGTGPVWAVQKDARVTPLGRLLRATHLDELPQLWNVIRGEMTLIGPRPERPEIAARLAAAHPLYAARTRFKPGVTGVSQILLPPDTCDRSAFRKASYDCAYMERPSLWFDLRLLAATAVKVTPGGKRLSRRLAACRKIIRRVVRQRTELARSGPLTHLARDSHCIPAARHASGR